MASHASCLIISLSRIPFSSSHSSSLKWVLIPKSNYQHKSFIQFNFDKRSSSSSSYYVQRHGRNPRTLVVRAAEYKFPDPIPEFAESEAEKFRNHLLNKLTKKEVFEDSFDEVVGICTEIFTTFLHEEYSGPGTLMVEPFMDMANAIDKRGLPGSPQAARAAIKWVQNHVEKDWNQWNGN